MYAPPPPAVPYTHARRPTGRSTAPARMCGWFEDLKATRSCRRYSDRQARGKDQRQQELADVNAKSTEATLANPTIFGRPITKNGVPLFEGSLDGETAFDGGVEQPEQQPDRRYHGHRDRATAERQPGHSRRKMAHLNQGREFIRLSGIIRPFDIEPDNSLLSTRIAECADLLQQQGRARRGQSHGADLPVSSIPFCHPVLIAVGDMMHIDSN